jgi:Leucine-rich repeat (LRR) protein
MNRIDSVPADIAKLKNLKELRVSNNEIVSVHPKIEELQELRVITLSSNRELVSLPYESLLKLPNLSTLTLFNTKLGDSTLTNRLESHATIVDFLNSMLPK